MTRDDLITVVLWFVAFVLIHAAVHNLGLVAL